MQNLEKIDFAAGPWYKYDITGWIPYTKGGFVKRALNCNGVIIVNAGDDPFTVNGLPLYPGTIGSIQGDSVTIGGNAGELFMGQIQIIFKGTGTNPIALVNQKTYVFTKQLY